MLKYEHATLLLMLTRRLQVLLDDDRFRRLEAEAERREVAIAVVVRDAIDSELTGPSTEERRAAARSFLAFDEDQAPMPDVHDLKADLATMHDRHGID